MSKLKVKNITLGDNVDTTKNIVVKVPSVADGTLTIETEAGTDLITVAADGKVAFPQNVVKVSGLMSRAGDNNMSAGIWDDVLFNVIEWQVGTSFTASPTYGFTAPRTGAYHYSAGLYITGTGLTFQAIEVFKNGSSSLGFSGAATAATQGYVHITNTVWLTAGDVVTVKGYASNGSSIVSKGPSSGTWFSVFEL